MWKSVSIVVTILCAFDCSKFFFLKLLISDNNNIVPNGCIISAGVALVCYDCNSEENPSCYYLNERVPLLICELSDPKASYSCLTISGVDKGKPFKFF